MPHELAWNMGTTMSTHEPLESASASGSAAVSACSTLERCVYMTPFGSPVVPLV